MLLHVFKSMSCILQSLLVHSSTFLFILAMYILKIKMVMNLIQILTCTIVNIALKADIMSIPAQSLILSNTLFQLWKTNRQMISL